MLKTSSICALAMALAIAGPGLALAQGAYPSPPPPGPGHWDHAAREQAMASHEARRLKAMHDVLDIKPNQESAFLAFASARHPAGLGHEHDRGMAGRSGDHEALAAMTTPERLDRMGRMMDEREARRHAQFEQVATATKTLYAELSPEQKRVMDALPELTGDHGHGGHPGEHGDHMRGGAMGPGRAGAGA